MRLEEDVDLPLPSLSRPRRQNQSCDACRSAKRRCSPADQDAAGEQGSPCRNCSRLGHRCTYDFAQARRHHQNTRKAFKKSTLTNDSDPQVIAPAEWPPPESQIDCPGMELAEEFLSAQSNIQLDMVSDPALPWIWSSMSPFDEALIGPSGMLGSDELLPLTNHAADNCSITSKSESVRTINERQAITRAPTNSFSRPALLLSSSLSDSMVGEVLARVYNSIVARNSMRWLRFEANPYAADSPYNLLDNDLPPAATAGTGFNNALPDVYQFRYAATQPEETSRDTSASRLAKKRPPISLLGAVRFLDHFSDFYGNRLGAHGRRASDSAIKATLTAYSMQWLPVQSNPQQIYDSEKHSLPRWSYPQNRSLESIYHQCWSHAKDTLENALGLRSFRIIYATFLFDAAAAPAQSHGSVACKNALLDSAFSALKELSHLVTHYAQTLGTSSEYSRLLVTSLAVIQWFGDLRDVTSSVINPRRPRPPELLPRGNYNKQLGTDTCHELCRPSLEETAQEYIQSRGFTYDLDTLDNSVRDFLRQHNPRLLRVTRAISTVKADLIDNLSDGNLTDAEGFDLLLSVSRAIDSMREMIGSFLEVCVENLDLLSAESKLLIGMFPQTRTSTCTWLIHFAQLLSFCSGILDC